MPVSSFILFCFRRAGDLGEFCVQVVRVRVGVRARVRARVGTRVRVSVKLLRLCLSVFRAGLLDARSRYKFTVCPFYLYLFIIFISIFDS